MSRLMLALILIFAVHAPLVTSCGGPDKIKVPDSTSPSADEGGGTDDSNDTSGGGGTGEVPDDPCDDPGNKCDDDDDDGESGDWHWCDDCVSGKPCDLCWD